MNKTVKAVLIISVKNAVNALLTNTAMVALFPQFMQWGHPAEFWWNAGKVAIAAVIGREVTMWGPKILKWSQTGVDSGAGGS